MATDTNCKLVSRRKSCPIRPLPAATTAKDLGTPTNSGIKSSTQCTWQHVSNATLDPKPIKDTGSFKARWIYRSKNIKINKIRHLRHQVTVSPKKDHETSWVNVAEEMEAAAVWGNSQRLLQLYATSALGELRLMKPCAKSRSLDSASRELVYYHRRPQLGIPWEVSLDTPTGLEVESYIWLLQQEKSGRVLFELDVDTADQPFCTSLLVHFNMQSSHNPTTCLLSTSAFMHRLSID